MTEFFERPPSRKARYSVSSDSSTITKRNAKLSKNREKPIIDSLDDIDDSEPYQCTGKFNDDFQILCKRSKLKFIPMIMPRAKRPITPPPVETKFERIRLKKYSEGSQASISVIEAKAQLSQIGSEGEENATAKEIEPVPKTYVIKDNYEFYKPKIQVEMENADKSETVNEIFIRGWKVESQIMDVFQQCLPTLVNLTSLNLWSCGLNSESIEALANFLPSCANLKNLNLDGNVVKEESFDKLILTENTLLQSLSLRNCCITDKGASLLGKAIGETKRQNNKLLTLNLSSNDITDIGAIEIAKGLRTNRNLLVLNLSGNQIEDAGAEALAETLYRFKLSHDEIVYRRTIKSEKTHQELLLSGGSPNTTLPKTKGKHDKDSDRPPSNMRGRESNKEKPEKVLTKKEKMEQVMTNSSIAPNRDRSKSKEITRDSSAEKLEKLNTLKIKRDSNSSLNDVKAKDGKREKEKSKDDKGKSKKNIREQEIPETDTSSLKSASGFKITAVSMVNVTVVDTEVLADVAEEIDGDLWIIGNRTLISLNLSRNKITEKGLRAFIPAIEYQMTYLKMQSQGLMRLSINKNLFELDSKAFQKLMELMKARDPILNKPAEVPNENTPPSVLGKEFREPSKLKLNTKH